MTLASPRQILFLQGLPGHFFRDLAQALQSQGHGVHRVNFNGGDMLAWRGLKSIDYKGASSAWPAFLARFLVERQITDLVLFGDCRPLHRMARATSMGLGVTVHVFEEGYIRPDWITLERGGVNGFSRMPRDPAWYRRTADGLEALPQHQPLPEAFPHRARATIAYYAAAVLLGWIFPNGRSHRPWPPLLEACGWLGRLARRKAARARSAIQVARLAAKPYFILPLQLDSDYQLRAHSDFDGMQPALAQALASFKRHAPPDTHLVVKEHPLDNGLTNWRKHTLDYARALGVEDRVIFLEVGDIGMLVRSARGVVTVNSTTGTLALEAGVPVFTLGRAVYDMEGLTHQGSLDTFWLQPHAPDLGLYEAFRRVLAHRCLLHGGFYDQASRPALVKAALSRILESPATLSLAPATAPALPPAAVTQDATSPKPAPRRRPSPIPAASRPEPQDAFPLTAFQPIPLVEPTPQVSARLSVLSS